MPLTDNKQRREILRHLFPGIKFESKPKPSTQRLVYLCSFPGQTDVDAQKEWRKWGTVALKVSEDVRPEVIARLENERRIVDSLGSTCFPRSLYSDVFGNDPVTDEKLPHRLFVAIEERVEGIALKNCKVKFAAEAACAKLLTRLVDGLQPFWNNPRRMIHRDLKPENIIIRTNGCPVIVDPGIMREKRISGTIVPRANRPGICNPAYSSPELLMNRKQRLTFRSDLFSLGAIAYELVAGRRPFGRRVSDAPVDCLIDLVLSYHPPSLARLGKASDRFSSFITRLLAKEPYLRPRTVAEVVGELRALAGEA